MTVAAEYAPASGSLQSGAWLLVALPLLSAAVLLLGGRRTNRWGHLLGAAGSVEYADIPVISAPDVLLQGRNDRYTGYCRRRAGNVYSSVRVNCDPSSTGHIKPEIGGVEQRGSRRV